MISYTRTPTAPLWLAVMHGATTWLFVWFACSHAGSS
jgi:hypothetical protein